MKNSRNMKKILTISLVVIMIAASTILVAQAKLPMGKILLVKPISVEIEGGRPQLMMSAPSEVVEGSSFKILVYSKQGLVADATVFWLNESYITDSNGRVILAAPSVDHDRSFTIRAHKQGYRDAEASIKVLNNEYPQLMLAIPSSMLEGREFVVGVYILIDNETTPIADARVFWCNSTYNTDATGRVMLTAPEVDSNIVFMIQATKKGYLDAFGRILIEDSNSTKQLMLAIPPSMLEGREFVVGVFSSEGPVAYATVFWFNGTYSTNSNGTVIVTAPLVNQDTSFEIRARKQGYQDAVGHILILNQLSQLLLVVPSEVYENDDFIAYVSEINGTPIEGARVGFRSGDYYYGGGVTGPDGTVVCTAPEVNQSTIYEMGALKPGYVSGFAQITVLDTDSGFGWIYGIVRDANTSLPLDHASVLVSIEEEPTSYHVYTNELGQYAIQVVTGVYSVTAMKGGYNAMTATNILVPGNTAVEVNFFLELSQPSIPTIVFVDDDFNLNTSGWGYDHFNTIQAGINAVADNGTVHVEQGTYVENIVIDKGIRLIGYDKSLVVICGGTDDHVVKILADFVFIGGFTIENSGSYDAGILVDHASHVTIMNNRIMNNVHGIAIESSSNCLVRNNLVTCSSQMGILLEYSSANEIIENTIISSGWSGVHIVHSSSNNMIYHNNFYTNDYSAYATGVNTWDNGYPRGGNYWDDYTGTDVNGDGIGDTPYSIPGPGGNQDLYPLMQPWG